MTNCGLKENVMKPLLNGGLASWVSIKERAIAGVIGEGFWVDRRERVLEVTRRSRYIAFSKSSDQTL